MLSNLLFRLTSARILFGTIAEYFTLGREDIEGSVGDERLPFFRIINEGISYIAEELSEFPPCARTHALTAHVAKVAKVGSKDNFGGHAKRKDH